MAASFLLASLIAAVAALAQRRLSRLAAAATLSHVPLAVYAVLVGEKAATYYVATVALAGAAAIYVALRLSSRLGTDDYSRLGGLYAGFPLTAWSYIGAALVLGLFPPFPSFAVEHALAATVAGCLVCLAVMATTRILLLCALFYSVKRAFFGPKRVEEHETPGDYAVPLAMVLASLALGILALIRGG